MKILVIGKNGQLAQAIFEISKKIDHDVFFLSQQECDVTNYKIVEKNIDDYSPSIIINTSAYNLVQDAEVNPNYAFDINCFAVSNLAFICNKKNIRFVTFSTDYVFDGSKGTPYLETDIPNPLQMYGLSKYAGEIASLNNNENSIIIRTNGVYGGIFGSPQKKGNFVLNLLKDAKNGKPIVVSNNITVNPTSAIELAMATMKLIIENDSRGIFHLASEGYCTWFEFAQFILKEMKLNCSIQSTIYQNHPAKLKRPLFSVLNNTRAKSYGIVLSDWKSSVLKYLHEIAI